MKAIARIPIDTLIKRKQVYLLTYSFINSQKIKGTIDIAGIDEGLDADETAISSNADTASEKSQSMPVWGIILIVVVAAIAVSGTVLFIRNKKKQK